MTTKIKKAFNKRITPREIGLLKGAINRVFSRSDLRKQALAAVEIKHSDPKRPRVKRWGMCPLCKTPTPLYKMPVDHIEPRVPVDTEFKDMDVDVYIERTWCDVSTLQAICEECHHEKTARERKERIQNKKRKKGK